MSTSHDHSHGDEDELEVHMNPTFLRVGTFGCGHTATGNVGSRYPQAVPCWGLGRTYYTVPVGNVDPTTSMVSNEFSNPVLISLERGTPSNNCREYMAMTKRTE